MPGMFLLAAAGLLLYAAYRHLNQAIEFVDGDEMNGKEAKSVNPRKVDLLAEAIGFSEGFGVAGAIPTRSNNPGDLKRGDVGLGTLGEGITVYATADEGWRHLKNIVRGWLSGVSSIYSRSDTFLAVAGKYVGGGPSNPEAVNWASNVVSWLNQFGSAALSVDSTLADWVNS